MTRNETVSTQGDQVVPRQSIARCIHRSVPPAACQAARQPETDLPESWTAELVEAQIREAIATLMALPDRERDWLMSCRSHWPGGPAAGTRRRHATPTPGAIDRMLPTLLWIRHLDEAGQRILWMRGLDMSWARIGAQIGRSAPTARRWHTAALALIAARLNRQERAGRDPGGPAGARPAR